MQTEFSEVKFMSDIQKQSQVGAPIVLPSRRKLIRLGAAAVPVVATLTSQSALAGNCISTSAWGSDQISKSASHKARHDAQGVLVTQGYTITAWNAARPGGPSTETAPWAALRVVYGTALPNNQNNITFANLVTLDPTKFKTPTGFAGTDKVVGSLLNDDKSFFAVAQLNFAANLKPPAGCVTDAVWLSIVAGTYPTPGNPWTLVEIALYLKNNSIVSF